MPKKKPLPSGLPILVVEDDGLVRMVAVDMLEDAGFEVLEAGSADAAWAILERTPAVGALFTDIDMPGSIDGLVLAGRVAERWPHIRLVVTSGGRGLCDREVPDHGRFLLKPYLRGQLLQAIAAAA
ncbi:response regulator [Methylorubrum populi]|uniref:Response regulator n=1 Tax=Methylorubrum rhodesianum TaxID=29427 RepID=A0ABU9ZAI8_9HYPH|nr:response regulator [Methylorubrum rhodesianum]MBK3404758.1 response regulator [Methylorubrum rhodesianum]MBY0140345.1 response regulator [Methylorubrum populi]